MRAEGVAFRLPDSSITRSPDLFSAGGVCLKTPQHLRAYGIKELLPSRKLWRAWQSYCGPYKKELLSTVWAMEHSGTLAQIGDPGARVDRVSQKELALILGDLQRETVTKRISLFAPRVPEWWQEDALCECRHCLNLQAQGLARKHPRQCQSDKMQAVAAKHPHWNKNNFYHGDTEARSEQQRLEQNSPLGVGIDSPNAAGKEVGTHSYVREVSGGVPSQETAHLSLHSSALGQSESHIELNQSSGPAVTVSQDCRRIKDERRARKHVAAILARNQGFRVANSYAIAVKDGARPGINAGANQVGFLAHTFGAHLFSREKQTWLDPRQSLDGFRKSYGWIWDPHLPDAKDCACVTGQLKLAFQEVCPKCNGAGFVIGGSMPDYGRQLLHWLLDRGIDEEFRRCGKCKRNFAGNQMCPGCGSRGEVFKKRSELSGDLFGYTQEEIAEANGLNVSTVRRYFTTFKRLLLVRTVPGDVWRKCLKCTNLPLYTGQCPGCGSSSDPIKRRDKQLIIWLTSRTLDKQIAATERQRLDSLVKWHKRWLDQKHQADLEAAVELAKKVLGEWEGKEHLLVSFHSEMRRRLASSKLRANLMNVLFPLQRE
jgi:hypothetical protein